MTEEEGVGLPQVIVAFLVAERLLDLKSLWAKIEQAEDRRAQSRIALFALRRQDDPLAYRRRHPRRRRRNQRGAGLRDAAAGPGKGRGQDRRPDPRRGPRRSRGPPRTSSSELGASKEIIDRLVRLYELDGVFGIAALGARKELDELAITRAYTRLGEVLGIDWAQQQVARYMPADNWERLLAAGLLRDFEQVRIDFLSRARSEEPDESVERWVERNPAADRPVPGAGRPRQAGRIGVSAPMLAQIASQARILLSR